MLLIALTRLDLALRELIYILRPCLWVFYASGDNFQPSPLLGCSDLRNDSLAKAGKVINNGNQCWTKADLLWYLNSVWVKWEKERRRPTTDRPVGYAAGKNILAESGSFGWNSFFRLFWYFGGKKYFSKCSLLAFCRRTNILFRSTITFNDL